MKAEEVNTKGQSGWWAAVVMFGIVALSTGLFGVGEWFSTGAWANRPLIFTAILLALIYVTAKLATKADEQQQKEIESKQKPRFDLERIDELSNDELLRLANAAQTTIRARARRLTEESETLGWETRRLVAEVQAEAEVHQMLKPGG